jgi:hypothetical protein
VDVDGVVFASWDPRLIGTPLADPREIEQIRTGDARQIAGRPVS